MYEYANRLASAGHDIMVYHSLYVPFNKPYRPELYLYLISIYRRTIPVSWFKFNKNIKFKKIFIVRDTNIRDADILFYTMSTMSLLVSKLSPAKGKKVNLVQGYETWITGTQELLKHTYMLADANIAISDFIAEKIKDATGIFPQIVYNAFDNNRFFLSKPIADRCPYTVSMLYSEIEVKGSAYGIEALKICHTAIAGLEVEMFGTYPAPPDLPSWIHYHRQPDNLCELYNSTAIFLTPSIQEGWGLTATEAMACGCALVSTDAEGLSVFAHHNETALLCETKNSQALADNLITLITNNDLRIKLAEKGHQYIQQFTWNKSVAHISKVFEALRNESQN